MQLGDECSELVCCIIIFPIFFLVARTTASASFLFYPHGPCTRPRSSLLVGAWLPFGEASELKVYYRRGEYMALLGGISFIFLEGLVRLITMVSTVFSYSGSLHPNPLVMFTLLVYAGFPHQLVPRQIALSLPPLPLHVTFYQVPRGASQSRSCRGHSSCYQL